MSFSSLSSDALAGPTGTDGDTEGELFDLSVAPAATKAKKSLPGPVEGAASTYAEVMAAAKSRIRLSDLGIETVGLKRAVTGGMLLSLSGPDCADKADRLAARMREVLTDFKVRIARPIKPGLGLG